MRAGFKNKVYIASTLSAVQLLGWLSKTSVEQLRGPVQQTVLENMSKEFAYIYPLASAPHVSLYTGHWAPQMIELSYRLKVQVQVYGNRSCPRFLHGFKNPQICFTKKSCLIDKKAYIKEYAKGACICAAQYNPLMGALTYASVDGDLQWAPQMLSYRLQ